MARNSKSSVGGKLLTMGILLLVVVAGYFVAKTFFLDDSARDLAPTPVAGYEGEDSEGDTPVSISTVTGSIEEMMLSELGDFSRIEEENGFVFEVYQKGVVLASYKGAETKIKIPDKYAGLPVLCIGEFGTRSDEEGYTTRRTGFMGNISVTDLTVPDSVIVTGDMCFAEMAFLEKLELPKTLRYYVASAIGTPWYEGLSDEFCTVGDGILIKYNGEGGEVTIPEGTKVISPWAMSSGVYTMCPDVTTIKFPSTLEYVCDNAVRGSYGMTSLDLPDSLLYIGSNGIDCSSAATGLEAINGGANIKYANSTSFGFTDYWPEFMNEEFTTIGDGVLIHYSGTGASVKVPDGVRVVACPFGNAQSVTLSNSVEYVGDGAFSGVSSAALTGSVKIIGKKAFSGSSVSLITIPDSVEQIGFAAFSGCTALNEVTAEGVEYIGARAFDGCAVLAEVKTGEKLKYIGQQAFFGSGLVRISTPENVKMIDDGAFGSCYDLSVLDVSGMNTSLGKNVLFGSNMAVLYCVKGSAAHNCAAKDATIKYIAE